MTPHGEYHSTRLARELTIDVGERCAVCHWPQLQAPHDGQLPGGIVMPKCGLTRGYPHASLHFLSIMQESNESLLTLLDQELPPQEAGVVSRGVWAAAGAWGWLLRMAGSCGDVWEPWGWLGATAGLGSRAPLLPWAGWVLGWCRLFLSYPLAAALKVISTSLECRGFSKHLPSGTTYHINHSPRTGTD